MSRLHDLTSKPHVGYLLKPYQCADLVNMLNAVLQNVPRRPAGRALPFAPSELPIESGCFG